MPRKFDYVKARDSLAKIGYKVEYRANDKTTFRARGTIRRLYNEKAPYIAHLEKPRVKIRPKLTADGQLKSVFQEKTLFAFKKLDSAQMRMAKASGLWSRKQFTKGGVIVEKPVNMSGKDYRVTFTKDEVRIKFGDRSDVVRRLDASRLAVDPKAEISRVLGDSKPKSYSLIVNGMSGPVYPANRFWWYMQNKLLPSFMDRAEEENGEEFDEEESREEFSDIFHVRII